MDAVCNTFLPCEWAARPGDAECGERWETVELGMEPPTSRLLADAPAATSVTRRECEEDIADRGVDAKGFFVRGVRALLLPGERVEAGCSRAGDDAPGGACSEDITTNPSVCGNSLLLLVIVSHCHHRGFFESISSNAQHEAVVCAAWRSQTHPSKPRCD